MPHFAQPLAYAPTSPVLPGSGRMSPPTLSEACGNWLGSLARPLVAWTTRQRRARTFHPRGEVLLGHFAAATSGREDDEVASERLRGHVLTRFSDALAKRGPRRFDVLGCALRFALEGTPTSGVQDLLFATIARPWTMPLAPFTTDTSDYLGNDYFAVSPFQTPEHRKLWFRLRPALGGAALDRKPPTTAAPEPRRERLARLIERGALRLELAAADGPWGPWRAWGLIFVDRLLADDPAELAFDPFANAAGIVPRGFVHALRRAIYGQGQLSRGAGSDVVDR